MSSFSWLTPTTRVTLPPYSQYRHGPGPALLTPQQQIAGRHPAPRPRQQKRPRGRSPREVSDRQAGPQLLQGPDGGLLQHLGQEPEQAGRGPEVAVRAQAQEVMAVYDCAGLASGHGWDKGRYNCNFFLLIILLMSKVRPDQFPNYQPVPPLPLRPATRNPPSARPPSSASSPPSATSKPHRRFRSIASPSRSSSASPLYPLLYAATLRHRRRPASSQGVSLRHPHLEILRREEHSQGRPRAGRRRLRQAAQGEQV